MAKSFKPAVLTANDLIDGNAVFLSPDGWKAQIAGALVAVTQDQADELLALGERQVAGKDVVGPYLIAVSTDGGTPVPATRRERIRASGLPTIPVGTAASAAIDRTAA